LRRRTGDERLARLIQGGNDEAFAELYERHHQALYRYCRSIVGNEPDAQDALQSAFSAAYAALSRGARDAPLRPWLYRIVHNEAVSLLRRRRPSLELTDRDVAPVPSAADVAHERERLTRLVSDLRRLTERQRGALVMRELSGLSHQEIGVALGTDADGAKQMIFEARRSLQEFVEGRDMDCDEVCRAVSAGGGRTLRARRIRAHLRECSACSAFAEAISSRSRELRALTPPLTGAAATGVLRRALASSGAGSGSSAGAGGGGGAGMAGAMAKTVAASAAGKSLAGAAILITAAAGATGIIHHLAHPQPARSATQASRGPAAGSAASTGRVRLEPRSSTTANPKLFPANSASRSGQGRSVAADAVRHGRALAGAGHGAAGKSGRGAGASRRSTRAGAGANGAARRSSHPGVRRRATTSAARPVPEARSNVYGSATSTAKAAPAKSRLATGTSPGVTAPVTSSGGTRDGGSAGRAASLP
jgi:RNA polymerase sigma factor (sigma-70 family)